MNYKEFESKIGTEFKEGDIFYICDLRPNKDIRKKPIRNIEPTKVMLVSNDKITTKRTIYYADYHFRTLNSRGTYSSKIIAPYDNTGYRSYTGISVNIFTTKEECVLFFMSQCDKFIEEVKGDALAKFTCEDVNKIKQKYIIKDTKFLDIMNRIDAAFCNKRDPLRIGNFLNKLEELWLSYPDLRFAQIYSLIESKCDRDIFYIEENDLEEIIEEMIVKKIKDGKK